MHEKKGNVTARLDAHCHMLSYTYWCIANRHTQRLEPHTHTLTHGASQEATGPVGQSLRVWFVCLDLIIETGLFLQPPLLFLYSYMREGGGERARERERERKQSFDSIS